MLKRVKRKTSKQHSVEKAEEFSNNSGKKEVPSEVELLQQVNADLKAEVKSLREQLEREKKASSEVKSLKTQQVCALTFKLANAVRQRERAEEELVKVLKEMEKLKEVIRAKEEELKSKDVKEMEINSVAKVVAQDAIVEHEVKETEDVKEVFETQAVEVDLVRKDGDSLASGELISDVECLSGEKNGQEQHNTTGELKRAPERQDGETQELLIETDNPKCANETEKVKKHEDTNTDCNEIAISCTGKDVNYSVTESPINESDSSQYLELIQSECDKILIKESFLENSPEEEGEEKILDYVPPKEISPLSSLELSEFESWKENSIQVNNKEESSHLDDAQNLSSEKCISSLATSSFETCEEYLEDKEELLPNFNTKDDVYSMNKSCRRVPDVSCGIEKYLNIPAEHQERTSEREELSLVRKNRRVHSSNSEDQGSSSPSPPPSPGLASSGYLSTGTDDRTSNLLMHYGILEDQSLMMHPGNYFKVQEATPKKLQREKDDIITESGTMEDKTSEDYVSKDQATPVEKKSWDSEANTTEPEEDIKRRSREIENDFSSQQMSEEVDDLKQQLKNALKEIEDLRLENKEMKKEMRKLSSTAEENAFPVKTTELTYRLLREIREREAMVQPARTRLTSENYGLDSVFSYSGNLETGEMSSDRNVRRGEDLLTRSSRRKASLPLKLIGAKLKEITRSVENMAMDANMCGETLSDTPVVDFMSYKQSFPNLSDHFVTEEQSIIPSNSSERLDVQSTPFQREALNEISRGGFTSVEKLDESFQSSSNSNHQLTERGCALKENTFQFDSHAQELSGLEDCWTSDPRDYIQRYVVRSSDYIAKLRDLKPEELAFYSKFR